jgi:ribonuclease HII
MARSAHIIPTLERETVLWERGRVAVAGVDEVGRGPLAGPVISAAVVLPPDAHWPWLPGVRDSKLLTPMQRRRLDLSIRAALPALAVGAASVPEIDTLGIGRATRLAMTRAVEALPAAPDHLLIDGRERVPLDIPQDAVSDGDARCLSIALASIVAKVFRDRLMDEIDAQHPGWGFARHKGYPTAEHRAQLAALGPLPVHRRSYAPVQLALTALGSGRL